MADFMYEFDFSDFDDFADTLEDFKEEAEQAIRDVVQEAAYDVAKEMADLAPVLTGALRDSLEWSPIKIDDYTWELRPGVPYTWRQEYEHRTKSGFIRRPMNRLDSTFPKRIEGAITFLNL